MSGTQSALLGSSSPPVGGFIDFPSAAPQLVTTGAQKYLRSGTTALASTYPTVPADLVGTINAYSKLDANLIPNHPINVGFGSCTASSSACCISFQSPGNTPWTPHNQYLYSTDGITWTPKQFPIANIWGGVMWSGTMFVVWGFSNVYCTSTDGINWIQGSIPTTVTGSALYINEISFQNNLYIAVDGAPSTWTYTPCAAGATGFWKSTDCITWTKVTLTAASNSVAAYGAYNGSNPYVLFYAVWGSVAWNGTTWCAIETPSAYPASDGAVTGGGGGIWMNQNRSATSTDLVNWTYRTNVPSGTGYNTMWMHKRIKFLNGKFYLLRSATITYVWDTVDTYNLSSHTELGSTYASSDNGVTFAALSGVSITGRDVFAISSTLYMYGGSSGGWGGSTAQVLLKSTDSGATWGNQNTSCFGGANLQINTGASPVAYFNSKMICHAANFIGTNTQAQMKLYSSSDLGVTWVDNMNFTNCTSFSGVAYGNGVHVLINGYSTALESAYSALPSYPGMQTKLYHYSNDKGATWQTKAFPKYGVWTDVQWNGTYFFAVSPIRDQATSIANGTSLIYRSTDGINWTEMAIPASAAYYKVGFLPGKVILSGYNGWTTGAYTYSAVSTNSGTSWTVSGGATGPGLGYAYAWDNRKFTSNGTYIVAGGMPSYSTDGINWIALATTTNFTVNATSNFTTDGIGFYIYTAMQSVGAYTTDFVTYKALPVIDSTNTGTIKSMAYYNGIFYVYKAGYMYTSADNCMTWVKKYVPAGVPISNSIYNNGTVATGIDTDISIADGGSLITLYNTSISPTTTSKVMTGLIGNYILNTEFAKSNTEGTAIKYMRVQ